MLSFKPKLNNSVPLKIQFDPYILPHIYSSHMCRFMADILPFTLNTKGFLREIICKLSSILIIYLLYTDIDTVEKEVILAVNGQESRIVFVDHTHGDMQV